MDREKQLELRRARKLNRRRQRRENREQLLDAMLQQEYLILITGKKYYIHPKQLKILSQTQIEEYIAEKWSGLLKISEEDLELVSPFILAKRAWQEGYIAGKNRGLSEGYNEGYNSGYDEGHSSGYGEGHSHGYDKGHTRGYGEGHSHGYDEGYSDGEFMEGD